ncbi:MAG: hypothetical protein J5J06_11800 [Phycisphaerae bacterium]|nr:hypothetical protein [Phycisphaerae bacterium]
MNNEALRKAHAARPFQPFDLYVADGRVIHVPHPEFLAQFPGGRAIIITNEDYSWDLVDLLMVTSIHISNGKAAQT